MTIKPTGLAATLLTVAVVMLVSSWTAVVARVFVRRWIKGLGMDDYLMCIGLVRSMTRLDPRQWLTEHGRSYTLSPVKQSLRHHSTVLGQRMTG